jgi:hypothetical protein
MTALLLRALLTALAVGGLLAMTELLSRRAAGLVAGLPTVTGPALFWLAIDQGTAFAVQASAGAVAAGAACALFAWVYAHVGRGRSWPRTLMAGLAASLCMLPLLEALQATEAVLLATVVGVCWICLMGQSEVGPGLDSARLGIRSMATPAGVRHPARDIAQVALVSAGVSALVSLSAGSVGAFRAGLLTSPPLIAALVAVHLHRTWGASAVAPFLRGYTAGLIGRSAFAFAFGALLPTLGLPAALGLAAALAALMGCWLARLLSWRSSGPTLHAVRKRGLDPLER